MRTTVATPADLPAITELYRHCDTAWFGAPEVDADEVAEELGHVPDLATGSLMVRDGDQLLAAAWWWGRHTTVLVAQDLSDRRVVIDLVLDRLIDAGVRDVTALAVDTELVDALVVRGWEHEHSQFDLLREVTADWQLPRPLWPEGVRLSGLADADHPAAHALVYDAARWADVPGHVRRDIDEWAALFLSGPAATSDHIVAWRGRTPVGLALTRTFSDGTGWISQLAVAADERRHGLGRALLLEGLRRRQDDGAARLGLGVQAANAGALRLYESVGLRVDREYRSFVPAS